MWSKYLLTLTFIVASVYAIYFLMKQPSTDGDWVPSQKRLPVPEILRDHVFIQGIRDFKYEKTTQGKIIVVEENYFNERYFFGDLKQVWYGLSHFGGGGLAHAFLSFEFSDGKYLVSSIEARMENGREYNPLLGLVRSYSRMMVLGTEQDVVGLRTHYRGEKTYLYPLKLSRENRIRLFKSALEDALRLSSQPDFYNTAADNCITGILQYTAEWASFFKRVDYRILLPGYSDRLAFKYDYIDGAGSFEILQKRAEITADTADIHSGNFSQEIRHAWRLEAAP